MQRDNNWQRTRLGLGKWPASGKVAVTGWANSEVDRRWDGKDFTKTSGAKSMQAIQRAMDAAGVTMDDIDGLITSSQADARAEQTWAPRPFFAPPYDSEDGIVGASAPWIQKQMAFKNIKHAESDAGPIWTSMNVAINAVATGKCKTALLWYAMCNLEGRYGHNNPANFSEEARGPAAFNLPWGYQSGAMFNNLVTFLQYCKKYGKTHDNLGYLCLNQRRNGLRTPWGYYARHEPYQLTMEDYRNGRLIEEPLVVFDCDRPMMTTSAFVITTAERAKDMKGTPVYALSHAGTLPRRRSTMFTLEEAQQEAAQLANVLYEGAGLGAWNVDIYNPYEGYLTFPQQFLEGSRWHGVGWGEAHDLYKQGIQHEGPHPFNSSGGNNGTGRSRAAQYFDIFEQLTRTAGKRQVTVRAEVGMAGYNDVAMFGKYPS